jgi:integrase
MRQRGLSEKTIRNTIDGSFRAMARDAEQDDLAVSFPFSKMRWPEKIVPGPSPFTERERDKILDYFRVKRWKVGGFNDTRSHYPYFAFLYTLFFTGMRPSELVAARVGSLNIHVRTLQVERSRHLGAEAAPKTQRARRTVRLTPAMSKSCSLSSRSRRDPTTISARTSAENRSKRRTFMICFVTRSARFRSRRCAICTRRKTPTSHSH